jgi:hypothetical protein
MEHSFLAVVLFLIWGHSGTPARLNRPAREVAEFRYCHWRQRGYLNELRRVQPMAGRRRL